MWKVLFSQAEDAMQYAHATPTTSIVAMGNPVDGRFQYLWWVSCYYRDLASEAISLCTKAQPQTQAEAEALCKELIAEGLRRLEQRSIFGPGIKLFGDGGQVHCWQIDPEAFRCAPEEFKEKLRKQFPVPGSSENPTPAQGDCVHSPESYQRYHAADCLRRALANAGCEL